MIQEYEINRLIDLGITDRHFTVHKRIHRHSLEYHYVSKYAFALIGNYVEFLSSRINNGLRKKNHEDNSFVILYECLLNKALTELNPYNNQIVYRMDSPGHSYETLKIWYKKRIGQVISFPNFLSTSKKRWKDKPIVFTITTSNQSSSRDLGNLSKKTEEEVLFMSKSEFKIIKVNDIEGVIELQEVNLNTDQIIQMIECIYLYDPEIEKLESQNNKDDSKRPYSSIWDFLL